MNKNRKGGKPGKAAAVAAKGRKPAPKKKV